MILHKSIYFTYILYNLFIGTFSFPTNLYKTECPRLYPKVFKGYIPRGNISAGFYEKIDNVDTLKSCVLECCSKPNCNVAFMTDQCFHIICNSNELCIPTLNLNPDTVDHVAVVLVKPTDEESWEEVLAPEESQIDRQFYNILADKTRFENALKNLEKDNLFAESMNCKLNVENSCQSPNEICIQRTDISENGLCECKPGFERQEEGICVPVSELKNLSDTSLESLNKSMPVTKKHLTVIAESKEIKLPRNTVTLEANTTPEETAEDKYQYEWTSLKQPGGSAAVKHQNDNQLHLEQLTEGIYQFKVSVSTASAYGETFVNVSVLPEARINTPPSIIITPANQKIKLPNTAAVLDASSSKDDDGIISWHWELQQGPLGYEPELKDSSTLQLNDLTRPGNYTFKLTVTDTDKASSISTANITVLAVTDYPPEANAGEDKIIYLPHNNITLNGSLSTDDHSITTWEWTKSADDAQKTVDMQNTRTSLLQLSNLQEGVYTFTLKVTDSANQSSTAQVHVFVKPPTNKPPVAKAGHNVTISLPQTWAIIDGSNSTDDNGIISYNWEQVEGPSTVTFEHSNQSKSNITGLTKGVYTIKLSVTDDNNNLAKDLTYIIVNQNQNQKPAANAGPDLVVELPTNGILINGSDSKDDWEIVKWKWVRDEKSLAVGNIVEKTDQSPILILTDVSVGTYILNLTVFDKQGLSDTDTVTVTVKRDPKLFDLVDLTINIDARFLTEAQFATLKAKLTLLVNEGTTLQVRSVKPEGNTGKVKLTFYLDDAAGQSIPANKVVKHLREKLQIDESIFGFSVAKLQTDICQNNCSGHGVCNEITRECECEAFWMNDLFKFYFSLNADSDCSWSVLYAILGICCSFVAFVGCISAFCYFCYKWCDRRSSNTTKPTNYKLIEDTDDLPPFSSRKSNLSDSESDSDNVVFETRNKPPRFSDSRNGHKRNGYSKPGRRIKA